MSPRAERPGLPLALTMGDPAGIGPEITLMAWRDRHQANVPPFAVFADPDALAARARLIGIAAPIEMVDAIERAAGVFNDRLPVRSVRLAAPVRPGEGDAANAGAVTQSIEDAVAAAAAGQAAAVVTNPISKSVLYDAGFAFPGHTEFLAHLADARRPGRRFHAVMMLVSKDLRVVPLSVHIPLASVPGAITRPLIFDTVRVMWDALRRDFGIAAPRIAVAGLNPHAGEAGTIGREEADIIAPAIAALRAEGLSVTGPHAADTLFHAEARGAYDAVLAMYHDQALIPIKTLAFDSGVNVTLGLPFVRTSPDHGTAFDIAGTGRANPQSLIEALRLAEALAGRRAVASERAGA